MGKLGRRSCDKTITVARSPVRSGDGNLRICCPKIFVLPLSPGPLGKQAQR